MSIQPISNAAYTADESAAGWIPAVTRANIAATNEERHAGSSWARVDPAQDSPGSVALSTPSDLYMACPLQIRVDRATTSLRIGLRYIVTSAAVDVRLAYGGEVGGTSTLAVTATPTTVELSVTGRIFRPGEIVVAELQIRSSRLAGVVDTISITDVGSNGTEWRLSGSHAGLVTGVTHYEAVVTSAPPGGLNGRTVYHVGRHDHGSDIEIRSWPAWELNEPGTGGAAAAADVYTVGRLTIYGWSSWSEGDRDGGLPRSIGAPGLPTSAALWNAAHLRVLEIYQRGFVWCAGPPSGVGASLSIGAVVAANALCGGVLAERRADSAGVLVSVLYLPIVPTAAPTMTVKVYGDDGVLEATVAQGVVGEPADETRQLVASPSATDSTASTAAWIVRDRAGGTIVGTRDLAAAGESMRAMQSAIGWSQAIIAVDWPAGVAVNELAVVTVEINTACHVRDVLICEAF
jgi:hypothetical protein